MSYLRHMCLFVGGPMSYLRHMCLFAHSVSNTYCVVLFVLFVFVLSVLYYRFLWIVHFRLPLRYSLTFFKKLVVI